MTRLRKKLKRFEGLLKSRPYIIDPDVIRLFLALGETRSNSIALAIIVQKIAHLAAKPGQLNMTTAELLDLFPFVGSRTLKRSIHTLRKFGVWKNKKYRPQSNMASYPNIRINWSALTRLAEDVQAEHEENELKTMCRRLTEKEK